MDELLKEFLLESNEAMNRLDHDLLALERQPDNRQTIDSIFRGVHTVKGTCGFLGFSQLERLTHAGENLLSLVREGVVQVTPRVTSALLQLVDEVRGMLVEIERTGEEGQVDHTPLMEQLLKLAGAPVEEGTTGQAPSVSLSSPTVTVVAGVNDSPMGEGNGGGLSSTAVAETAVRVDIALLDRLMDLVGELVLSRNQILQYHTLTEDAGFHGCLQRLNSITTNLQEGIMKTRMQPIGNVWAKFPRIVRDLSQGCGKSIEVLMEGKETEMDRTVLEAIRDPLTHLVRNSVDHGIETPEVRLAHGKPSTGTLRFKAYHESGQVTVEIADDGRGIDPERIRQKAIEKGLISHEQSMRMEDAEALQLIFLPGFSTAEQVTNLSGRGVGMDVVRANIEKVGGTVDLQSRPGAGTTITIKIPLTLAIIPALIVTSGGDRYAIPQVNLLELVRLEGRQMLDKIEMVHQTPVFRLRGNLLPLVYLKEVLQVEDTDVDLPIEERVRTIIVLQADGEQFGLVVEGVNDTEEIVVKPLSALLKANSLFAGATILGDGRVALILDAPGIAQHLGMAEVESGSRRGDPSVMRERPSDVESAEAVEPPLNLLLFGLGADYRVAVPLEAVARLEEVRRTSIERAGGQRVVQYRGSIMPLIDLPEVVAGRSWIDSCKRDKVSVVVYQHAGKALGLVVGEIIDIVEEAIEVQRRVDERGEPLCEKGIMGSAVIQGQVTDLLDVGGVLQLSRTVFFEQRTHAVPLLNN